MWNSSPLLLSLSFLSSLSTVSIWIFLEYVPYRFVSISHPPLLLSALVLISYSLCSLNLPLPWCQNTTNAIELGSNCNNLKVLSSIVHVIHCWLRALNECDAQKQHSSSYSELLAKLIVLSVRLPNSIRFSNESLYCVCTHIRTTLGLHTRQNVSSYCCCISFNLNVSNSDKNCGDDDMLSKTWFG